MLTRPDQVGMSTDRLARITPWMQGYVDRGQLPGLQVAVLRGGEVAYHAQAGLADIARQKPVAPDTIYRLYSMSKPITSVAVMMLYEQGHFLLDDPISRWIPEFAETPVFGGGTAQKHWTVPAERGITVRDLLTHTSGLTYGFMEAHPVDEMYRTRKIGGIDATHTLAEMCAELGQIPLLFQPGTRWNYSNATDVLGRLVELWSGQSFDAFLGERIFGPLGMVDTAFFVPDDKLERFAANYGVASIMQKAEGCDLIDDPLESGYRRPRPYLSGGGGLVGTIGDYLAFVDMLRRKGAYDGGRLLGRKTVEYMARNHLPGGQDLAAIGDSAFSEISFDGFGLGGSVVIDPVRYQILTSAGEFAWGGAASTAFWVDFEEDMAVVMMTQYLPSSSYPIRRELRVLVAQAIVE